MKNVLRALFLFSIVFAAVACEENTNIVESQSPPQASMSILVDDLRVSVTVTSPGAESTTISWGDGSPSAACDSTCSHSYDESGTYRVSIVSVNEHGSDSDFEDVRVGDADVDPPIASFTWTPQEDPFVVQFFDSSEGEVDAWRWRDRQSDWVSTLESPIRTFSEGAWTIELTVSNSSGSDVTSRVVTCDSEGCASP